MKTTKVGSFKITSGKVRISDPCYKLDTWCAGTISNVKNGKWNASVVVKDEGQLGKRVACLIANNGKGGEWEEESIEVGVDSGQCGIIELSKFNSEDDNYDDINSWYRRVCELTLSNKRAGIIDNSGVVSSSGYGDGCYVCMTSRNKKGEVVGIMIDFDLAKGRETMEALCTR